MRIAVVTGTRAEYGLLAPIMQGIEQSPNLDLQVLVTGSHLLDDFGLTVDEIASDGFHISRQIPEITSASSGIEVARQVGTGMAAFADALVDLEPSAVLLLGDRYEIFAAASAAFFLNIPIVHLHGGEITAGAFDDAIRHAISQLARVHAVAAPEYGERLIRAGADPSSVHLVGGLGVDSIRRTDKLSRNELEAELGLRLKGTLLLVTYHPVTLAVHDTRTEIRSLVKALDGVSNATVVLTMPNTDPEHATIVDELEQAVSKRPDWHFFASLGSKKYISLLSLASAVVGNSSSGLTEAPTLGVPAVNVGPRQDGRLLAPSVICCGTAPSEIREAIARALSNEFVESIQGLSSPYGESGAADRVLALLESTSFDTLEPRKYYDLPMKT